MTKEEYKTRLLEIRVKVNELCDDLGATYSTAPEILERVLNVAMNGDLSDIKRGKVNTRKIISVCNYRALDHLLNNKSEYM